MGQNFENGVKLKILKRASFVRPQICASFVNDAHASFPLKKFPGQPRVICKRRARVKCAKIRVVYMIFTIRYLCHKAMYVCNTENQGGFITFWLHPFCKSIAVVVEEENWWEYLIGNSCKSCQRSKDLRRFKGESTPTARSTYWQPVLLTSETFKMYYEILPQIVMKWPIILFIVKRIVSIIELRRAITSPTLFSEQKEKTLQISKQLFFCWKIKTNQAQHFVSIMFAHSLGKQSRNLHKSIFAYFTRETCKTEQNK